MELKCSTMILIVAILVIAFLIFNVCKSTFGGNGSVTKTSDVPKITNESVLIFYAPWCGHCKKSKPEFEKAVEEGNGKVVMVDVTNDENEPLVKKYEIKGFPTIIRGNGEKFDGPDRTAGSIIKFLEK
jgi:protein disulfide-isomerase A6